MKLASSLSRHLARNIRMEPCDVRLGLLPDLAPQALREFLPRGFNPSWASDSDGSVLAVRKSNTDTAIIESKKPLFGDKEWKPEKVSIAREIQTREGPAPIRDLRFFRFREAVWHTFNTGHPPSIREQNDILLGPLESRKEEMPYRAIFPERRRVEKNWAFFGIQDDLFAIYSVDPIRVLTASHIDEVNRRIHFVDKMQSGLERHVLLKQRAKSILSIGSQPAIDGDSVSVTVHEKLYKLGKFRSYFPRVLQFQLSNRALTDFKIGPLLYHSEENLRVGSSINPFAFGVTYASGLDIVNGELILGYGIADEKYRFIKVGKL